MALIYENPGFLSYRIILFTMVLGPDDGKELGKGRGLDMLFPLHFLQYMFGSYSLRHQNYRQDFFGHLISINCRRGVLAESFVVSSDLGNFWL